MLGFDHCYWTGQYPRRQSDNWEVILGDVRAALRPTFYFFAHSAGPDVTA